MTKIGNYCRDKLSKFPKTKIITKEIIEKSKPI